MLLKHTRTRVFPPSVSRAVTASCPLYLSSFFATMRIGSISSVLYLFFVIPKNSVLLSLLCWDSDCKGFSTLFCGRSLLITNEIILQWLCVLLVPHYYGTQGTL